MSTQSARRMPSLPMRGYSRKRRVGFLILAFGLALYLTRLVLRSSEGVVVMADFALGMLALGLGASALWIKVGTKRVRQETHEAARSEDAEIFRAVGYPESMRPSQSVSESRS
jgi:hypothetical protein